jgi:Zn-dependent protease
MPGIQSRSIHLFSYSGIDVYLNWSWFLVALYEIDLRSGAYSSISWNVLEYLGLFAIVLLHEFGHALACRQVGGTANTILLWPFGGIAYVSPPQRPGATLWSIAAGPLVNVILVPILFGLSLISTALGWQRTLPDAHAFLVTLASINLILLVFNILPVYPLDGGQILRSVLWFWMGRARSLTAAAIIGLIGVGGLILYSLATRSVWLGAISVFILLYCWKGLRSAQALSKISGAPRREGFACPVCKTGPPVGAYWVCSRCRRPFDTFASRAVCPACGTQFTQTACFECGASTPMSDWVAGAPGENVEATPAGSMGLSPRAE